MARMADQIALNSAVIIGQPDARFLKRIDDLNAERPNRKHRPVCIHLTGYAHIVLLAVLQNAERPIHHIQLRIEAEGHGKEHLAIRCISIEKETVVEIPVGSGKRHRIRRLVKRIIVRTCYHLSSSQRSGVRTDWGFSLFISQLCCSSTAAPDFPLTEGYAAKHVCAILPQRQPLSAEDLVRQFRLIKPETRQRRGQLIIAGMTIGLLHIGIGMLFIATQHINRRVRIGTHNHRHC